MRKPIGVYLSVALVIFGLTTWGGHKVGAKAAVYWNQHLLHNKAVLAGRDGLYAEGELHNLEEIGMTSLFIRILGEQPELRRTSVLQQVKLLQSMRRVAGDSDLEEIIDQNLTFAYAFAAIGEDHENKIQAAADITSAEKLCGHLGWKDCSESALRAVAEDELSRWDKKSSPNSPH
ncbi:MAG TPA: hypothetical protein VFO34_17420 [Candidatus Acidoferrales bacterium]|nr:hypothetical protein [Candidatus Acidoferrales bacterium]